MAGLASAVVALIILLAPVGANAGDLFTGFRMDSEAEYFAFMGIREFLPWEYSGVRGYAQLFGSGLSYEYDSSGHDIDADVQSLIPSLGLTTPIGGGWSISSLAGPELRWKKEDGFQVSGGRDFDVGAFVQLESMYWQETHSLHGIISYGSLDDFVFGRIRGKMLTYSPQSGCCSIFTGMDVAGMGNSDFEAVQVGPLMEVPIGRFFLLGRAGYQWDSSNDSGGYGGLEIYTEF